MVDILPIRRITPSNQSINQSIKGVMSNLSHEENGGSLKTCDFNWFYHNFDDIFIPRYMAETLPIRRKTQSNQLYIDFVCVQRWYKYFHKLVFSFVQIWFILLFFLCSDKLWKKPREVIQFVNLFCSYKSLIDDIYQERQWWMWSHLIRFVAWKRFTNGKPQSGFYTLYFISSSR